MTKTRVRYPWREFVALPLPEGWTCAPMMNGRRPGRWVVVVAGTERDGVVTVDLDHRCVRDGLYATSGAPVDGYPRSFANGERYSGAGWLARLHEDAVRRLHLAAHWIDARDEAVREDLDAS